MTYQELVAKVKSVFEKADAHEIKEHVAVQINVEGEAEGIFYLEAADGSVKVEPYDYRDRDLLVVTSAATLTDIAEGRITGVEAAESGRLRAEGNFEKAGLLRVIDTQKVETTADESKEAAEEPSANESAEAEEEEKSVTGSTETAEEKEPPAGESAEEEKEPPVSANIEEEPPAGESTEAEEEEEPVTGSTETAEEKEPPVSANIEAEEEPPAGENAEEEEEEPVIDNAERAADESKEAAEEPPKVSQPEKTPAGRQMSRKQRKKWKKKKTY